MSGTRGEPGTPRRNRRRLPRLGMRIVKTGICVFICLTLNYLFSTRLALVSAIASIVCLQSSLEATKRTSLNQFLGTALGGAIAMALLPVAEATNTDWMYLLVIPVGLILAIYLCIVLHLRGETTICAFVYVTILIVPFNPDTNLNAYELAGLQIVDTAVGVLVAMLVNRFVAPPKKRAPQDVHLESTYLDQLAERLHTRLTGLEELIVIDTAALEADRLPLTHPKREDLMIPGTVSIRVPVPMEFGTQRYLNGVYITQDLNVIPFYLLQKNGYADMPQTTRDVTIAWHAPAPSKETYGWLQPKHLFAIEHFDNPPRLLIQKYREMDAEREAGESAPAGGEEPKSGPS